MMLKKIIFHLLFLLLSYFSYGQKYVDLAKIHYANTPPTNFDSIAGNTTIREFGADINLPIKLDDDNVFLTGFYLEKIRTQLHPQADFIEISTINLKVGFNKNHSEKWNGTYILLPKISSDFKKLTHKDFQIGGLLIMKYKKSENFKYHMGVYANNDLFGVLVSPLIGFYYKSPNDKLEANFTLPIWADVNYKVTNWMNIGTSFTAITRSYNLGNNNSYVTKKSNDLFGYLQFNNSKKTLLLQTKIGYAIGRSYQAFTSDDKIDLNLWGIEFGDDRKVINPDIKDGLVFKIRLLYRFNI